jgi:hypothetical protein
LGRKLKGKGESSREEIHASSKNKHKLSRKNLGELPEQTRASPAVLQESSKNKYEREFGQKLASKNGGKL